MIYRDPAPDLKIKIPIPDKICDLSISALQSLNIEGIAQVLPVSNNPGEVQIYLVIKSRETASASIAEFVEKTRCLDIAGVTCEIIPVVKLMDHTVFS
jgi:hypothetical protein